jgi:hypothetical protein
MTKLQSLAGLVGTGGATQTIDPASMMSFCVCSFHSRVTNSHAARDHSCSSEGLDIQSITTTICRLLISIGSANLRFNLGGAYPAYLDISGATARIHDTWRGNDGKLVLLNRSTGIIARWFTRTVRRPTRMPKTRDGNGHTEQ